jgi:hypothetical protein
MPGPANAAPADLPARVFRALFADFELRTVGSTHVAVPKGTPWYAGPSLAALARQISSSPPCAAPSLRSAQLPANGTEPHDRRARPR